MAHSSERSVWTRNGVHYILAQKYYHSPPANFQVFRPRKYVAPFKQKTIHYPPSQGSRVTLPTVPSNKPTKFERTLFASPSTPEADLAWGNDLTPPGDGFVLIPNPQLYSLPPGQPTKPDENAQGEIYDISVFHQLHCLNHVRTFLLTLKAGVEYGTVNETYDNMLRPQEDHVYHCFDYIRQALMCNADLTVEWPREEESGERVAVDGWGVEHQCKDWVS